MNTRPSSWSRAGIVGGSAGVLALGALTCVACLSSSSSPPALDAGATGSDSGSPLLDAGTLPTRDGSVATGEDGGGEPNPHGLWFGTVADGGTQSQVAVLLTGTAGAYWVWQYGPGSVGAGAVGSGSSTGFLFTTSEPQAGTPPVSITVYGSNIQGALDTGDASATTFQANEPASFQATAPLSAIVGAWSSEIYSGSYGDEAAVITITADGGITMDNPLGCTATGSITPHTGSGYYDLSVTFSGGDCIAGTSTLTGVAVVDATNPAQPQLLTSILTGGTLTGPSAINFPSTGTLSPDGG